MVLKGGGGLDGDISGCFRGAPESLRSPGDFEGVSGYPQCLKIHFKSLISDELQEDLRGAVKRLINVSGGFRRYSKCSRFITFVDPTTYNQRN